MTSTNNNSMQVWTQNPKDVLEIPYAAGKMYFHAKPVITPLLDMLFTNTYGLGVKDEIDSLNRHYRDIKYLYDPEGVPNHWGSLSKQLCEYIANAMHNVEEDFHDINDALHEWKLSREGTETAFVMYVENLELEQGMLPRFETLFRIATDFNDGHNLWAIEVEGSEYFSAGAAVAHSNVMNSESIGVMGGHCQFISTDLVIMSRTSVLNQHSTQLNRALEMHDHVLAAQCVLEQIDLLINGIQNPEVRKIVRKQLASDLQ